MRAPAVFLFSLLSGVSTVPRLAGASIASARERISLVALNQAEEVTPDWDPGQRDCAGFVRFVYRTALGWRGPLFKGRGGEREAFLSARALLSGSFERLTRDPRASDVRTGDVLAWHDPEKPSPEDWHLMLLLEPPRGAQGQSLLVYHNGAKGSAGLVKKVWLGDLWEAEDLRWRPRPTNPHFIGVFRWKEWWRLDGTVHANHRTKSGEGDVRSFVRPPVGLVGVVPGRAGGR